MRILAIAGSLRARSSNRIVLEALSNLAPPEIEIVLLETVGALPLFNADLDTETPPTAITALRAEVGRADGLVICSPEYARGISAVLKNLLEWLVASAEFPDKPVAVINASQRATEADGQLRLILKTMSARLIEPACITMPMLGRDLDADGIVQDATLAAALRQALSDYATAIANPA